MLTSILGLLFGRNGESDPQREYQNVVLQLEGTLKEEIKSPKQLEMVNALQFSLSDIADCAFVDHAFFTRERVDEIYNLLRRAADYLAETIYQGRAAERPDEFRKRVEAGQSAAEAIQRLNAHYLADLANSANF